MESYNKKDFNELGITEDFVQDNHSKSTKGVLRGLHFQWKYPQGKLVRVVSGAVYDVAVDLRKGSATYGQYYSILLSEENKKMLYIPKEFAHGFLTLTERVDLIYKVTDYYYPEYDSGIIWNDPNVNISWPFKEYGIIKPILSNKDEELPKLEELQSSFSFKNKMDF